MSVVKSESVTSTDSGLRRVMTPWRWLTGYRCFVESPVAEPL